MTRRTLRTSRVATKVFGCLAVARCRLHFHLVLVAVCACVSVAQCCTLLTLSSVKNCLITRTAVSVREYFQESRSRQTLVSCCAHAHCHMPQTHVVRVKLLNG